MKQRIGERREYEQHDGDRDHLLGLQKLHGVDDQEPNPGLRGEHLGQKHPEQRQGEAYPQARDDLRKRRREKHRRE